MTNLQKHEQAGVLTEQPLPKIETRDLSVDLEKRKVEVHGERFT